MQHSKGLLTHSSSAHSAQLLRCQGGLQYENARTNVDTASFTGSRTIRYIHQRIQRTNVLAGFLINFQNHRRCSSFLCQAAWSADHETEDDRQERRFVHALLLCFLASQNRSLFAAKCLAETVVEMYRRGYTIDDVKLAVTLATLSSSDPMKPMSNDILMAWTAIVMMTLRTVGVPLLPEGEQRQKSRAKDAPAEEDADRMTQGLAAFVQLCVDRYLAGTDLYRLQLQQSMQPPMESGDPAASGESPSMYVMQQNTRLAIITLDVVRSMQLPTAVPLHRSSNTQGEGGEDEEEIENEDAAPLAPPLSQPIGYATSFLVDTPPSNVAQQLTVADRTAALRAAAVRLLIFYNGAALGYLRPARAFIEDTTACYSAGWTAEEIVSSLKDEEFAQSGGVMRFGVAALGQKNVSTTLFARWVSVVYMTLAIMGVRHPGATEQVGWAWVEAASSRATGYSGSESESGGEVESSGEFDSATEAHGIADFVRKTLLLAAEESGGEVGEGGLGVDRDEETRSEAVRRWGKTPNGGSDDDVVKEGVEGFATRGFEDPELLQTSSFAIILSQQISLVRLTRMHVLEQMQKEEAEVAAQ